MEQGPGDPLFGAAILKLSFLQRDNKRVQFSAGFKAVYLSTIKELELTDRQVDEFIAKYRNQLEAHILEKTGKQR